MSSFKFRQCLTPLPTKVKILDIRKVTLTLSSHPTNHLKVFRAFHVYIFYMCEVRNNDQ